MMTLEQQQVEETKLRAAHTKLFGSDKGFEGFMVRTETPCPVCVSKDMRTNGGEYIVLSRRSNGVLWCHHHGDQA